MPLLHHNINKQDKFLKALINVVTNQLKTMEIDADMADLNLSGKNTLLHLTAFENVFQTSNCKNESDQNNSAEDENNSNEPNSIALRRSLRRRIAPVKKMEKQAVFSTAKKIIDGSNLNELKKYYTNKSTKRLSSALETIYEDSVETKSGNINTISKRKFKRVLSFGDCSSIWKIRKRQLKSKKLCKAKRKKISMSVFQSKLKDLNCDETSDN